jgi:hypothetical protein
LDVSDNELGDEVSQTKFKNQKFEEINGWRKEKEKLRKCRLFSIYQKGVYILAEGLCFSPALKSLNISRNMRDKGSRLRNSAIESLINLISSECPLETLILQGGKGYAVNCLFSTKLHKWFLDITSNSSSFLLSDFVYLSARTRFDSTDRCDWNQRLNHTFGHFRK